MIRFLTLLVTMTSLLLATVACGGDDENAEAGGDPQETIDAVTDDADPFEVRSIELELGERRGSGQYGYATLTALDPERTYVVVRLFDGPDQQQAVHLHDGTCGNPGQITHSLERPDDIARSATVVRDSLEAIVGAGLNIAVHETISAASDHVLCEFITDERRGADVDADDAAQGDDQEEALIEQDVEVELEPLTPDDVSGTATLSATAEDTVEVRIELEGAAADTTHPAHLHRGRCGEITDEPGAPHHDLGAVEGGTLETTLDGEQLIELLDGNFSIDAHESEEGLEVTIACGELPGKNEIE